MHDEYEAEGFLLDGSELEDDDTLDEAEAEAAGEEEEDEDELAEIPPFEDEEE